MKLIQINNVPLGKRDLDHAFRFYENACNTLGYAQDVADVSAITQDNIDDVVTKANEMGFTTFATESDRELEVKVLELKTNNGFPKVFTSFYGNAKVLSRFGVVIVRIAILAPRFSKAHASYLKLAPTKDMLYGVKNKTMSSAEYKVKFEAILSELVPEEVYEELTELGNGRDVAIMCYERPPDTCHRHYVTSWMKAAGYEVPEFPFL